MYPNNGKCCLTVFMEDWMKETEQPTVYLFTALGDTRPSMVISGKSSAKTAQAYYPGSSIQEVPVFDGFYAFNTYRSEIAKKSGLLKLTQEEKIALGLQEE